jgi:hypothetical protein
MTTSVSDIDTPSREETKNSTEYEAPRGVEFFQLDVRFDEKRIPQSGWGRLRFSTDGWIHPLFCNLTVGDRWQVRNVLVVPDEPHCALRALPARPGSFASMTIPLGTRDGVLVERITYGLSFMPKPLSEAPPSLETALVTPGAYSIDHDFADTPVEYYPGQPLGGVFFTKGTPHGHSEIHNHPCGGNECVPNAVRLALEYLYIHYGLSDKGIPWKAFELAVLKANLDWTRGVGCPNGQGGTSHWEDLKDTYLTGLSTGHGFKISTKRLGGSAVKDAYQALGKEECVVELDTGPHCVAVRTMTPNLDENGNVTSYDVEVMNCAPQDGKDSSCTTEHLTVKSDGTVTDGKGAPWYGGEVRNWCVQCYKAL